MTTNKHNDIVKDVGKPVAEKGSVVFWRSTTFSQVAVQKQQQRNSMTQNSCNKTFCKTAISLKPNNNDFRNRIDDSVTKRNSTDYQSCFEKKDVDAKKSEGTKCSRAPQLFLKIVEIPFDEKRQINNSHALQSNEQPTHYFPLSLDNKSRVSISPANSSIGSENENIDVDYRVVSLDSKPYPGSLENFIPENERNECTESRIIGCSAEITESGNIEKPHILRNYHQSCFLPHEIQQQRSYVRKSLVENVLQNKDSIKSGGMYDEGFEELPLLRDQTGKIIVQSNVWRAFLAEQRPQTSVPLNSPIRLIHYKERNFWQKPKIIARNELGAADQQQINDTTINIK